MYVLFSGVGLLPIGLFGVGLFPIGFCSCFHRAVQDEFRLQVQ